MKTVAFAEPSIPAPFRGGCFVNRRPSERPAAYDRHFGLILKDLRRAGPLSGSLCFKRDFRRPMANLRGGAFFWGPEGKPPQKAGPALTRIIGRATLAALQLPWPWAGRGWVVMYEAFYGLDEKPFNLTPDPRFLYLSEKHRDAFAHLVYGIRNRAGFVMISGEIGTGKTTICRTLVSQLDPDTEIAFIFNPYLEPLELLRKINEDFGIPSRATTVKGLVDELNSYLLERRAEGKNCVLAIDEAQNLKPALLEQIRLLSNLETESEKLLQIILIGQPELGQMLELPELRQLNQRIVARYHLESLDEEETLHYIASRLKAAGGHGKVHFAPSAVRAVYRISRGTPRVINALCDRALLIGYTRETKFITKSAVKQAAREIRGKRFNRGLPLWRRLLPTPALAVSVILLVILFHVVVTSTGVAPQIPVRGNMPPAGAAASLSEVPKGIDLVEAAARDGEEAAPQSAKSPLDQLEPQVACNAAALALLRMWNLALVSDYPDDDSAESLKAFLETNGLVYEALPLTLEQCAAVNLPAFLRIGANRHSMWVALIGWGPDEAEITTGVGGVLRIPRDELERRYLGRAILAWREQIPAPPVLLPAMTGDEVRRLQEQLVALGRLDGPASGVYDDRTVAAVAALQKETGIEADGKAGRQTRMVLASWLPGTPTPRLRALAPVVPEAALASEAPVAVPDAEDAGA